MQIKIVGQALIITSAITFKDIERAKKLSPDCLTVRDEDKNPTFLLTIGDKPALSTLGASFNASNAEGKAQMTLMLPNMAEDKRIAYVTDTYGAALVAAIGAEAHFNSLWESRSAAIAAALNNMEVD